MKTLSAIRRALEFMRNQKQKTELSALHIPLGTEKNGMWNGDTWSYQLDGKYASNNREVVYRHGVLLAEADVLFEVWAEIPNEPKSEILLDWDIMDLEVL